MRVSTPTAPTPPTRDLSTPSTAVAAAPAVALPAGAGIAAASVAAALLASAGIGWNTLSPREQARTVGAVTGFFARQVQSGKMSLQQLGGLVSGIVSAGTVGTQAVLQRNLSPAQRTELERAVMLAAYEPPSVQRLTEVMDKMEFFQGCKRKPREELEGRCGDCSTAVIRELRKLGIRATFEAVGQGDHGYVRVIVKSGEQLLNYAIDCMISTYSPRDNPRSENTYFGPEHIYKDILNNIRRQ